MPEPVDILLVVYQLNVGGNERDVSKLARYINPRRFRVHIGCFHDYGERRAELDEAGIPIVRLPVTSLMNPSLIPGALRLRSYIREHDIRLIQTYDPPTSIFAVPVARALGVPVVLSSHQFFRFLIPSPQYQALRAVDFLSHRIVVNAHAIKEHLIHDYNIAPERIFVSHNGVETAVFHPEAVQRPAFLDGASLIIGALCVFRQEKCIDVLLEAFARVLPLNPRMKLLIVGDGPMRGPWMELSKRLGLQNSCHFEITTTDVPYWLRCMDVFVLTSRSEGFPNSLLEAMTCGCAAVASSVGGVPEMMEEGRSGLLFTPGDVEGLASHLRSLAQDMSLVKQLGQSAAVSMKERFPMEITAKRMEDFYESLLHAKATWPWAYQTPGCRPTK